MTANATLSRRRSIARAAGAAAAAIVAAGLLSAGVGGGEAATASADLHPAGGSTTALDEPAVAAKRRITKSNVSDYLKVVLKEAS